MKLLVNTSRYIVGILFIISGLIKLNDPSGFSYKLNEYFAEDVLNLPFLIDYTLPIAVFIVIYEVVLGALLLMKYKTKFTLWNLLLMIVFFSFLTFYSAYFEKVQECGCFGDAIPLTPWQSFIKDIVLLFFILILYWKRDMILTNVNEKILGIITTGVLFSCIYLAFHVLNHLPVIDFRGYKIGTNINEAMSIPKGAQKSVYEDIWYYRVNGEVNEYKTDDAPWGIKGSEFVDRETTEVIKGYKPPIHDFVIELNGEDHTQNILSIDQLVVVVMSNFSSTDTKGFEALKQLHITAQKKGYRVIGLTGSQKSSIQPIKKQYELNFEIYTCDETALKTFIRANPGIVTLEKGTITQKLNWKDIGDLKL